MTAAMLIHGSDRVEAGSREVILDQVLRAIDRFGVGECLVCGQFVSVEPGGRVHCGACGATLGRPSPPEGQLAMV
jgi:hypothetical protein